MQIHEHRPVALLERLGLARGQVLHGAAVGGGFIQLLDHRGEDQQRLAWQH